MKKYLTEFPFLCNDVIFKSVFTDCEFVLEKFIYDLTGDKLDNIKLFANEIPIVRDKEKFKRCDFLIKQNNTIYNIELNNNFSKTNLLKNICYIFSLFASDASKGEKYNKELNIVQININNFTRYNKPILDYKIINDNYGYIYLDSLKIYELDIVKCNKLYYNERIRKRKYLKWGALFSCTSLLDMAPILDELLTKEEKDIFMEKVNKITKEDYIMSEAEALRLDEMFRKSIREEGIEEGILKGKSMGLEEGKSMGLEEGKSMGLEEGKSIGIEEKTIDIIKSMLANNFDLKTISKITSKSICEIEKIKKNMKL